jgi:hypothetical protein
MASIRDAMGDPWWASMYSRFNVSDPSNKNYGWSRTSGLNQPLVIESNRNVSIQLSRHCNGICTYDIGNVTPNSYSAGINECSDTTGAPYLCAKGYLGQNANVRGSYRYDRLG